MMRERTCPCPGPYSAHIQALSALTFPDCRCPCPSLACSHGSAGDERTMSPDQQASRSTSKRAVQVADLGAAAVDAAGFGLGPGPRPGTGMHWQRHRSPGTGGGGGSSAAASAASGSSGLRSGSSAGTAPSCAAATPGEGSRCSSGTGSARSGSGGASLGRVGRSGRGGDASWALPSPGCTQIPPPMREVELSSDDEDDEADGSSSPDCSPDRTGATTPSPAQSYAPSPVSQKDGRADQAPQHQHQGQGHPPSRSTSQGRRGAAPAPGADASQQGQPGPSVMSLVKVASKRLFSYADYQAIAAIAPIPSPARHQPPPSSSKTWDAGSSPPHAGQALGAARGGRGGERGGELQPRQSAGGGAAANAPAPGAPRGDVLAETSLHGGMERDARVSGVAGLPPLRRGPAAAPDDAPPASFGAPAAAGAGRGIAASWAREASKPGRFAGPPYTPTKAGHR